MLLTYGPPPTPAGPPPAPRSRLPDGTEDLSSLHSAEPVRCGDKWITTRWGAGGAVCVCIG